MKGLAGSRKKKAAVNSVAGLLCELITVISGLILPRLILSAFGSQYNGVTSSITQFLSFVTLLSAGVGAVTKAALYKPLERKDHVAVSRIMRATESFLRKVAFIFLGILAVMSVIYPFLVIEEFDWFFTATLVVVIGLSTFAEYYFGLAYQMLLEADQCYFVHYVARSAATLINLLITMLLIRLGFGIHAVKLGSSIVFCISPMAKYIYVKRKYQLDRTVEPDNRALSRRWDAFAQQIALMVRDNSSIVILTFFTNTLEVSVYNVYFMVIKALNSLLRSFSNGMNGAFGNMLAKGEHVTLAKNFGVYELLIYTLSIIMYSVTSLTIVPFVMVYTSGIVDVNYARPAFGYLLSMAYLFYCIRIPYQMLVEVAGHFRQTRTSAIIEVCVNISVSCVGCAWIGLEGIALGMLSALLYRTVQYACYVTRSGILLRSKQVFFKRILLMAANMALILVGGSYLPFAQPASYYEWTVQAAITAVMATGVTLAFNWIFYRVEMKQLMRKCGEIMLRTRR